MNTQAIESQENRQKFKSRRNPFPDAKRFFVPIALFDSGMARVLKPTELVRYVTLCRIANYRYGKTMLLSSVDELEKIDRIPSRTAFQVHRKLAEFGLIQMITGSRPYAYFLNQPESWEVPNVAPYFVKTDPLEVELKLIEKGKLLRLPKNKERQRKDRETTYSMK